MKANKKAPWSNGCETKQQFKAKLHYDMLAYTAVTTKHATPTKEPTSPNLSDHCAPHEDECSIQKKRVHVLRKTLPLQQMHILLPLIGKFKNTKINNPTRRV